MLVFIAPQVSAQERNECVLLLLNMCQQIDPMAMKDCLVELETVWPSWASALYFTDAHQFGELQQCYHICGNVCIDHIDGEKNVVSFVLFCSLLLVNTLLLLRVRFSLKSHLA